MESTINERVREIADKFCKGNVSELARVVGVKQPLLRDIVSARAVEPSFKTLSKIVNNATLNISGDWLLTGKGGMQKSEVDVVDNDVASKAVPVYDLHAAGGLKALLENDRGEYMYNEMIIPNTQNCDGVIYARDDAMYPLLNGLNIAVYKQLHSIGNLIEGEICFVEYEIEGDYFLMMRYVEWEKMGETLRLVSYNKRYIDRVIPVNAVISIAYVRAIVDMKTII